MRAADVPCKVLVLQGGGALGSYQAGVFEALDAGCFLPDWVAGTSIGAINGALIVGNRPEDRLEKLTEFWTMITSGMPVALDPSGQALTIASHQWAANMSVFAGAPGFFQPHWPPVMPWLAGPLGYYDTRPLQSTLEKMIDWDLLNSGEVRLSVGAVNAESGNFRYFDTEFERLGPEHVMASAALPPGFAPVLIEGEYWWDGGLVSNTPLEHVLDMHEDNNLAVIQVDLFPARGALPANISEVEERVSDIRFSSRTRLVTNAGLKLDAVRKAGRRLLASLPPELADGPQGRALAKQVLMGGKVAIGQLIYRDQPVRGAARGHEFSRLTMGKHWASGLRDMQQGMGRLTHLLSNMPDGISSTDLIIAAPGPDEMKEAAE